MRTWPVLFLSFVFAACASVPASPDSVGERLVAALDDGDVREADGLFDSLARDPDAVERVYPVLYEAAEARFDAGEPARASAILRFMAPRYPDARSVREAWLYALFLERAESDEADPALVDEMETLVGELEGPPRPLWVDLAATQVAVDRGRGAEAGESYVRFVDAWSGEPASLMPYVEDLERWIRTHR